MARVVALSAVGVLRLFMLLQRAPPNVVVNALAVAVSLAANIMSVVIVSFLGRSLSVMPETRILVQNGPYGVVRHPLYLCEMLGIVAVAL
jgi:protein-S-isoprenylcysteine O-methyltransferase Ste14